MKLPFVLPPPEGFIDSPSWNGEVFILDGKPASVLEYSENFAGWSDDLTSLHEEAAGDSHPIDLASRKHAIEQVRKAILYHPAVIMEIGCSSGFLIKDLIKIYPESIIIGADVVKEPLYKLARELPGVPLIRFDLLKCPLPDRSIDVLIMLNVLEHIEDDIGALTKAYELLKPGGSMIIEVPACPFLYDAYDSELQHFRRYSANELHYKLRQAGFTDIKKSHLGFLLFPAFAIVKLLSKIRGNSKIVVHKQVANTSNSSLIAIAMFLENRLLHWFPLPFGIRVLITCRK